MFMFISTLYSCIVSIPLNIGDWRDRRDRGDKFKSDDRDGRGWRDQGDRPARDTDRRRDRSPREMDRGANRSPNRKQTDEDGFEVVSRRR